MFCIEAGIDSIITSELLKSIPLINTLASIFKAGIQFSDRIFIKKLLKFLYSISNLSSKERALMMKRLNEKDEYRNKVGERIIEIIDRVESYKKPEIVGKMFCAYVQSKISYSMLRELLFSIDRIPCYEFENLREFQQGYSKSHNNGLLVASGFAEPVSAWDGMQYKPTELCNKFIELNFDR